MTHHLSERDLHRVHRTLSAHGHLGATCSAVSMAAAMSLETVQACMLDMERRRAVEQIGDGPLWRVRRELVARR